MINNVTTLHEILTNCLHGAGSAVYSGVGGGCMLSSLSNFPAIQEVSALRNMDPGKVKAMDFYNDMLLRWTWIVSLEVRIRKAEGKEASGVRNVEMTGVRVAVSGQEMAHKAERIDLETHLYRAGSAHGFHNGQAYWDTCVKQ